MSRMTPLAEKRERDRQMRMAGHLNRDGTYKNAYPNKQAAKRWLKPSVNPKQGTTPAKDLDVYRCRFCEQWHIGHKPY